ncbi:hypothetical protein A2U01_0076099, partial [Trifolium medium]|nr:hypothetical protein [Trifolium medium]
MSQISAHPAKVHRVLCNNQMSRLSRDPSPHRRHSAVVDDEPNSPGSKHPGHGSD